MQAVMEQPRSESLVDELHKGRYDGSESLNLLGSGASIR